jgi:putative ABC transport system permease protein
MPGASGVPPVTRIALSWWLGDGCVFARPANLAEGLARSPGYAAAGVAVLALGIGANTSIFSVVYAVILKPLPSPNTTRLVFMWEKFPFMPEPIGPRIQVQRVAYLEWQRQSNSFADMAAFQVAPLNEAGVDRPRSISTGFASATRVECTVALREE